MKHKQNNKRIIIVAIMLLTVISIGYAAIGTNLTIDGTVNISKTSWDIHFESESLKVTSGSVEAEAPTISADKTKVEYEVTLEQPGDFYEFTVDVKNAGTINAKIAEDGVTNTTLTAEQDKYVNYTVTYLDGTEIKPEDKLAKNGTEGQDTRTIKIRVEYDDTISLETLNALEEDITLDLTFDLNYVQD